MVSDSKFSICPLNEGAKKKRRSIHALGEPAHTYIGTMVKTLIFPWVSLLLNIMSLN